MYQRTVGFGEAINWGFSRMFQFEGRSSRSEFWWWYLFVYIVIMVMSFGAGMVSAANAYAGGDGMTPGISILYSIVGIVAIAATLGISVRRLHDSGRGGGWYFISFIPVIGNIWLLVLLLQASEPHDNRFGPVPNLMDNNGGQTPPPFNPSGRF